MAISKKELIREFTEAIQEGEAAIFAGAGLSRDSGFVDWKSLLKPLADEMGLNIEKENDLTEVAQFYRNERATRHTINKRIIKSFSKDSKLTENIKILTRLPIETYWTTNYDKLLEKGFDLNSRKVDVKITQENLARTMPKREAILYKMHGDVDFPDSAILTKDDYESYEEKRPLFRNVLKGELVAKTFLFIGFSFEDPNLNHILSQIHSLIGENKRDHYCFFKKIIKWEGETEEEFSYRKARQDLKIADLKRYGIQAVLLKDYGEITEILKEIEENINKRKVFVSGSVAEFTEPWNKEKAEDLAYSLAQTLIKNDCVISSGFGIGIGSAVINGALDEIYKSKYKNINDYLYLRPFPQNITDYKKRKELFTKYREDIIKDIGVAIFLFGNKEEKGEIKIANGCLEEFKIAKEKGKIIIPIGSTGYVAKQILEEIKNDIEKYSYLKNYINDLETKTKKEEIIKIVLKIIDEQNNI